MEAKRNREHGNDVPKPVSIILDNRSRLAEKLGVGEAQHTPPAMDHYPHLYPWDSSAAVIILSHYGFTREAESEVNAILNGQRENGMVPNIQRVRSFRNIDPELLTFTRPRESADYSQPPIWPTAIARLYEAKKQQDPYEAKLFLDTVLVRTASSLDYFKENRQLSEGNPLIFNVMPQETGRDSDESLNGYSPKLASKGMDTAYMIELINSGSDYFGKLALGGLNRINGWNPQKIRRYYEPVDPMFNSIYAANKRVFANLAAELEESSLAGRFLEEADAIEERIISDLYEADANDGKGAFVVHNKGPQPEISISSLGPLLLDKLPERQLESILDLMDEHFDSPYPLPTISTQSRHYDPEGRRIHRVWTGEVMMIGNWLASVGLRKQAARGAALFGRRDLSARSIGWSEAKIIPKSKALLRQGYYEGFSSQTGRPRRAKTVRGNFVWNGLIETL